MNWLMSEESRKLNPGGLLVALGFFIFGAVIVAGYFGRTIPVFGQNLFIPILMILVGRAMSRRSRSQTASPPHPVPQTQRRPPARSAPPPPRSLTNRPEASTPTPPDEIVVAPMPTPKREAPPAPRAAQVKRPDPVHYPMPAKIERARSEAARPKTSAEMIAEAKERLKKKG